MTTSVIQDVIRAPRTSGTGELRITRHTFIDEAQVDYFYGLYRAAFRPMQDLAAARHLLTADEFAAEMADKRITKHVVWCGDQPVGLQTTTNDLSAVAWISPRFFQRLYPEHFARNAVLFIGLTLVHPDHRGNGVLAILLNDVIDRCHELDAVVSFDVCAFNDARTLGHMRELLNRSGGGRVEPVDTHTYYVATVGGTAGFGTRAAGGRG